MIGRSRAPGRHRAGQPVVPAVHRRLWDGPARAEADRLTRAWPTWLVLYSLGRRRFYAIAAWPAPEPLMVADDTAEGLEEQMREAETAFPEAALPTTALPTTALPTTAFPEAAFPMTTSTPSPLPASLPPEGPTAPPLQAPPMLPPSPGRSGGATSPGQAWRRTASQTYAAAPQPSRHPYRRAA